MIEGQLKEVISIRKNEGNRVGREATGETGSTHPNSSRLGPCVHAGRSAAMTPGRCLRVQQRSGSG
jgi:hypothetical protein